MEVKKTVNKQHERIDTDQNIKKRQPIKNCICFHNIGNMCEEKRLYRYSKIIES